MRHSFLYSHLTKHWPLPLYLLSRDVILLVDLKASVGSFRPSPKKAQNCQVLSTICSLVVLLLEVVVIIPHIFDREKISLSACQGIIWNTTSVPSLLSLILQKK